MVHFISLAGNLVAERYPAICSNKQEPHYIDLIVAGTVKGKESRPWLGGTSYGLCEVARDTEPAIGKTTFRGSNEELSYVATIRTITPLRKSRRNADKDLWPPR